MGKNQHYVPRLLLRNFSNSDSKKTINLYYLKEKKTILGCSISNQASKDYIYGKNQDKELYFGNIEKAVAPIFGKLINGIVDIDDNERLIVYLFINYQLCRTPIAAKNTQDLVNSSIDYLTDGDEFAYNKMKKDSLKITDYYDFMFGIAAETVFSILDLKITVVNNETQIPFILGQHPVVIFNPFLIDRKWVGGRRGTANKGAIIFMPLSTQQAIILYDKDRYKLIKKNRVIALSIDDINKLNACQFATTENCVYFGKEYGNIPFQKYHDLTNEYRNSPKSTFTTHKVMIDKKISKSSEIIVTSQSELPITQEFSFIGIRLSAIYENLGNSMDISRESIKHLLPNDYPRKYKIR